MATDEEWHGVIGRTVDESKPWFPAPVAPRGKPNVVVVLLDDTGFGQLGAYGSDIRTPTMDRLASEGLRYNQFNVTALCSPSRASLLTGQNHHAVGMGFLCDLPTGFPGYTSRIPPSAATLARVLGDAGWSTMAVGKWHLTPRNDRTASGPFGTWPLGMGFDRYYGFLHGDANHWAPTLVSDNHYVDPPAGPEDGYHLSEDLADNALRMIGDQQQATPGKPFFMYLAPGAMHAPHHVPKEWADQYAGQFDGGWERWRDKTIARQVAEGIIPADTVVPPRPSWVQAWDDLPAEERRLYARFQEVFAGFLTHLDAQLGRLLDGLEEQGILDDTIIMLMSDNGASGEGGQGGSINEHRFAFGYPDSLEENAAALGEIGGWRTYNHYPWGWAWAGNAPFRLWKRYTWLGGVRAPFLVRYPRAISDPGSVRSQFAHIVDVFPTILDLCGVQRPMQVDGVAQRPLDGRSLAATLRDAEAAEARDTQYFEMLGSRSIFHAGWKATTDHVSEGVLDEVLLDGSRSLEDDRWHLFHLQQDFAEAQDLADSHPEKLRDLAELWEAEAKRNQVFPMSDSLRGRLSGAEPMLWPTPARHVLRPGLSALADEAVPALGAGGALVTDVDVPEGGGEGVLCALGDWNNGWALVVLEGRPVFLLNVVGREYSVRAEQPLEPGRRTISFRFVPDGRGAGVGLLQVDGRPVAEAVLAEGVGLSGMQIGGGGLHLGRDRGLPVSKDYWPPFAWTGVLHEVVFDANPPAESELLADARRLLARE